MYDLSHIRYFKDKNIEILPNLYLNDNYPNCFLVKCEQNYFKIRTPSGYNNNAISCETYALKMLYPILGDMIPQILESDCSKINKSYIVETFFPGKSLDKFSKKQIILNSNKIAEQLYKFMKSLYEIKANGHGELNNPLYSSYKEWLLDKISYHISFHRKKKFISNEILDKIFTIIFETKIFDETPSHFLHFDIKPQNLIFDIYSQRLFVIDFEFSRFGDVEHELFRAEKKSYQYSVFMDEILLPVIHQYRKAKDIRESKEKVYIYSLYYYLSELTYLLYYNKRSKAESQLHELTNQLD